MQDIPDIPDITSSEGWTEVPYKTHSRPITPGLLYLPIQNASHRPFSNPKINNYNHANHTNRNYYQNYPMSKPIRHYWTGFTHTGDEIWMIELENGNLISNKEPSYPHLVKKHFPNDIIR